MGLNWFPLYHGDYLRDTTDLSAEEHGIYLLLLMHFFGNGPIRDDLNRICRIAADSKPESVRFILERYWDRREDGWHNTRMERIRTEQEESYSRRAEAGRLGGLAKASNARAMLEQSHSNATSSATSNALATRTRSLPTSVGERGVREKRFTPPTREEVIDYAKSIGYLIRADLFIAHYEANGWVQGRGKPIKDWRAAVRTWRHREEAGKDGIQAELQRRRDGLGVIL